jgi:TetR/AcrR family transcriptional regulator
MERNKSQPTCNEPDSLPRGRWQRRPKVRRAEILDAAFRVFGRYGFRRGTLGAVAKEAGVCPGTVSHYFGSKQRLFEAVVAERSLGFVANEEAILAAHRGSARDLLQRMLSRLWDHLWTPGTLEFVRVIHFEAPSFPESGRVMYRELNERWRRLLAAILEVGIRTHEFRQLDVEVAQRVIPFIVLGVAQKMTTYAPFDPGMPDRVAMQRAVWELVDRFVTQDFTVPGDNDAPVAAITLAEQGEGV